MGGGHLLAMRTSKKETIISYQFIFPFLSEENKESFSIRIPQNQMAKDKQKQLLAPIPQADF